MNLRSAWVAGSYLPSHKILSFYGARQFITVFTTACYLSLCTAASSQAIPQHYSPNMHSNHILPSTPMFSKQSLSFLFPPKPVHTHLIRIRATCSAHLTALHSNKAVTSAEHCPSLTPTIHCPVAPRCLVPQPHNSHPNSLFFSTSNYAPPLMSGVEFNRHMKGDTKLLLCTF